MVFFRCRENQNRCSDTTYTHLVRWLNSSGYKTKNRRGQWEWPTVRKILSREVPGPTLPLFPLIQQTLFEGPLSNSSRSSLVPANGYFVILVKEIFPSL